MDNEKMLCTNNISMKSVGMSKMNVKRVKIERPKGQNWALKWSKNGQKSKSAVFHSDLLWILRGPKTWQLKGGLHVQKHTCYNGF